MLRLFCRARALQILSLGREILGLFFSLRLAGSHIR